MVPYTPDWAVQFEKEKQLLLDALPALILAAHQIGSTAVEGLAAKPIVDILIVVLNLEKLDASNHALEKAGYECMGEFGIKGRRYFRKSPWRRTHQIHAFMEGDPNILRHLAFRDYLNSHPAVQLEYAALKTRLASTCNNDINVYSAGKNDFIKYHERLALRLFDGAYPPGDTRE